MEIMVSVWDKSKIEDMIKAFDCIIQGQIVIERGFLIPSRYTVYSILVPEEKAKEFSDSNI